MADADLLIFVLNPRVMSLPTHWGQIPPIFRLSSVAEFFYSYEGLKLGSAYSYHFVLGARHVVDTGGIYISGYLLLRSVQHVFLILRAVRDEHSRPRRQANHQSTRG